VALTATNQVFLTSEFRSIVFGGVGVTTNQVSLLRDSVQEGYFGSGFRPMAYCVIPACEFDMTMNSKCVIVLLCESKYNFLD